MIIRVQFPLDAALIVAVYREMAGYFFKLNSRAKGGALPVKEAAWYAFYFCSRTLYPYKNGS